MIPAGLVRKFKTRTEMAQQAAKRIAAETEAAIGERGRAALAFSGGSTPAEMLTLLGESDLDWSKAYITLVDDRWVDPGDPQSNERLLREALLSGNAGAANFVPLKTSASQPADALEDIEARLEPVPAPLDIVVLGLGTDGHTASLFPDAQGLDAAADLNSGARVAAIKMASEDAPVPLRITLTAREICAAREIIFLLTGEDKYDTLEQVFAARDWQQMPAKLIFDEARGRIAVYWAP